MCCSTDVQLKRNQRGGHCIPSLISELHGDGRVPHLCKTRIDDEVEYSPEDLVAHEDCSHKVA